ncbi:MAG TPA: hypothetical protein VFW95_08370 [Candidatus Limnocylindria bacterium]|nr:hypothetical protein [Candidatus Limnocylindria bacterium]
MTDESVECFNCGRANPEWAQVCRSCGVPLRRGQSRTVPTGRFPTDRDSLISIGAVIGTILVAVIIGLFVSSLNPTDATVGQATPTPGPTASPTAEPSVAPSVSASAAPPSATPVPLPGTVAFGTALDGNNQVVEPVDTFTPGMTFAHSISSTEPFGASQIGEEIVRINEDGSVGDQIVDPAGNKLGVDPAGTTAGFVAGDAANFVRDWGPGVYEMRIYVEETLIAKGQFRLAEG